MCVFVVGFGMHSVFPISFYSMPPAKSHIHNSFKLCFPLQLLVVPLLSCVQLFVTPWTAACQASLPFIISQSLLKLMSIESVMPSNHPALCHHLLLLPSIFPSIRVFSNELALKL